jgi:plastocyanin
MGTLRRLGWTGALLLVGIAMLSSGCGDDDNDAPAPNVTINIVAGAFNQGMMAFSPANATARVGNVVRMHNGDSITHNIVTVTANGPTWGSLGAGANRDVTVNTAGTFTYQCIVGGHTMTGEIVVSP